METAYDTKELLKKVQSKMAEHGLTMAEESLEVILKSSWLGIKEWAKESAVLSPNPVDNFIMPALDYLDPYVNSEVEKIDFDGSGS